MSKKSQSSPQTKENLAKLLVKLDLIEREDIPLALAAPDYLPICHFALSGYYDEWEAIEKIATELELPIHKIDQTREVELIDLLDQKPLSRVEPKRWKEIRALPFNIDQEKEEISIVLANPIDHEAVKGLEFELGIKVKIYIGKEKEILAILATKLHFSDENALDFILKGSGLEVRNPEQHPEQLESSTVTDDANAAPIIRLVNKIFADAIRGGASDVHITPQKDHLSVKARVDGIMKTVLKVPQQYKNSTVSRIKLLCGMDISEKRRPQDGRLRLKTPFGVKDLRISTVPSAYGENVVARILSSELTAISFSELGMNEVQIERLERSLKHSSRVNLVVGPTGSGKTSTLYACLLHMVDGKRNIITLEDPIEYRIDGITQIQVNPKIDFTFAEGLRSVLRQDPDVILVGEIRDPETASIAMQVAQTGHLVLSTLHTNSAPAAITRLLDLDVPDYLIASSIGSVMAQRLVRKLCEDCCIPLKKENFARFEGIGIEPDQMRLAYGCDKCGHTGYKGRQGIFSFLEVTDDIAQAIRDSAGELVIREIAAGNGHQTLIENARDVLQSGVTSIDEIERVIGPIDQQVESKRTPQNSAVSVEPAQSNGVPSGALEKRRVLLVEDNHDTRVILKLLLEKEMFEVVEAVDGEEALNKLFECPPHIIVSDVMMPKLDGFQMLERIRADSRTKDLPVLMLTANDTEESELALIKCGADDFVSKTTSSDILVARVRRLLSASI